MEFGFATGLFVSIFWVKTTQSSSPTRGSKGFPLQSLTQNHVYILCWVINFKMGFKYRAYSRDKLRPSAMPLWLIPKALTLFATNILRKHHISYQVCYVSYPLICVRSFFGIAIHCPKPNARVLGFIGAWTLYNLLSLHVFYKIHY